MRASGSERPRASLRRSERPASPPGVEDVARVGLPGHTESLCGVNRVSASPGPTVLSDGRGRSLERRLSAIQQLLGGSCYYY